jgi:hypothetical protein
MSIAVSVLTTGRVARNSGGAARQEKRPQSATAYSSVRCGQVVYIRIKVPHISIEKYTTYKLERNNFVHKE